MQFLYNNSKGLCSVCGQPLGSSKLGSKEFYCYNCENYVILPIDKCIQNCNQILRRLRESFRELILEGDARRYLRSYLNVLETIFVSDTNEIAPIVDVDTKIEILPYNQSFFITMNLAIKWILEDLNYKLESSNKFSMKIASNINAQWFKIFQQKTFLENDLGIFISRFGSDKKEFYYYQYLDFYQDSLDEYSTFHKDELTSKNYYEKITEFFEKRKNPENVIELARFDLTLTYLCSLYNLYPNKEDRMFSFNDIIAGYDVPIILKKIIDIYDEKRSLVLDDLKIPGNNFFAITNHAQLMQDLKNVPWSPEILYNIFVSSQKNPVSFPLLIEFGNEIYVSPTRLKVALKLIKQRLIHTLESNFLSKNFEIEFQKRIISILKNKGIKTEDPISNLELINLKDKKNDTFEIDILGYDEENIYIIESKSFHPHPFYMLKEDRERRKLNLLRFNSQFSENIKPWLINRLANKPINRYITIQCYQQDIRTTKGNLFQLSLPERFMNISPKKIVGLYITQLNEIFSDIQSIHQLYFKDIH